MTSIEFPGPLLHQVPAFSCSVPDGWVAVEAPGALLAASPPAGTETTSAPRLRIEWARVPAATTLRDLGAATLARWRRAHPDLQVVTRKLGMFGTRPAHLCGVTWHDDATAQRLAQLQVVTFAPTDETDPSRPVVDAFVLTGECAEGQAQRWVPEFVRTAASVRFVAASIDGSSVIRTA